MAQGISVEEARKRLALALRTTRESKMSQEEASKRADITQSVLSRWERGAVSPTVDSVWYMAEALGIDPVELLRAAFPSSKEKSDEALALARRILALSEEQRAIVLGVLTQFGV